MADEPLNPMAGEQKQREEAEAEMLKEKKWKEKIKKAAQEYTPTFYGAGRKAKQVASMPVSEAAGKVGKKASEVAKMPAGKAAGKVASPFSRIGKVGWGVGGALLGWAFRGGHRVYRNVNLIGLAGLLFLVIQIFNFFTSYEAYSFRIAAEIVILFLLIFIGVPIGLSVLIACLDYGLPTLLLNTIVQQNPPYAFLQPLANIVPEFSALTQSALTVLIVAFTPSLVLIYIVMSQDIDKSARGLLYSLGRGIYMIAIIITLFSFFFFSLSAAGVSAVDPIAKVTTLSPEGREMVANAWQNVLEFPTTFREGVGSLVERQIQIATGGQYYGGEVEQAREPVGVYITEFGPRPKDQVFYEGEQIYLWADLEVASYAEGAEITIETECKVHDTEIEGKTNPAQFVVDEKISRETIPCIFEDGIERDTVSQKQIDFIAKFNFQTESRITAHLSDRQNIIEYPSNKDVYDAYNVPFDERSPTAEYTQGPIELGIGINDPVPLISANEEGAYPAPVIGITVKPRWKGEISKFNKLYAYVPKGVKLSSCDNSFNPVIFSTSNEEYKEGTNAYSFEVERINQRMQEVEYYTITCTYVAEDIDLALRDPSDGRRVPLAPKSFFARAEYDFALEESATISIRRSPPAQAGGEEGSATS